ncbi:MAG: hypothetical protein RSJ40_02185 [Acetivibrio sp.]
MQEKLMSIAALLIASCMVMIIHEVPKTMVFFILEKKENLGKELLHFFQFIDPIGLIFCISGFSGFSKSYVLRAKSNKTNFRLGVTGLLSLFFTAIIGILLCKYAFLGKNIASLFWQFIFMICQFGSVVSMGMFFVNLFPIGVFDMGFLIGGLSSEKYFSILRNDYFIKMILILTVILGIIKSLCAGTFLFLYRL